MRTSVQRQFTSIWEYCRMADTFLICSVGLLMALSLRMADRGSPHVTAHFWFKLFNIVYFSDSRERRRPAQVDWKLSISNKRQKMWTIKGGLMYFRLSTVKSVIGAMDTFSRGCFHVKKKKKMTPSCLRLNLFHPEPSLYLTSLNRIDSRSLWIKIHKFALGCCGHPAGWNWVVVWFCCLMSQLSLSFIQPSFWQIR